MERLGHALELNDETAAALREEMERNRELHRAALEERRAALRELRESLGEEPVREDEIARALERLEENHGTLYELERRHHERLSRILTPSQRARFLVFSQRFDERLREMLRQRRGGPAAHGDVGRPRGGPVVPPARGLRGGAPQGADVRADLLRRRLDRLEREIDRVREELREIEPGE